jgi:hypothetical protein
MRSFLNDLLAGVWVVAIGLVIVLTLLALGGLAAAWVDAAVWFKGIP